MIKLGDLAKDIVTGFAGTVTGKAEYLTGYTQFYILGGVTGDGDTKGCWYDETRLEKTGESGHTVASLAARVDGERAAEIGAHFRSASGGPQDCAPKRCF